MEEGEEGQEGVPGRVAALLCKLGMHSDGIARRVVSLLVDPRSIGGPKVERVWKGEPISHGLRSIVYIRDYI